MTAPTGDVTPTADPVVVPDPVAPEAEEPEQHPELSDFARREIAKKNREAENLRQRLKALEPLAQEAEAAREAQKTEAQKATERAEALAIQLAEANLLAERNGLAAQYAIPATHHRYIVGDSPEERADAAKGIAEMLAAAATPQVTAPPTDRPAQALRPGAAPTPPDDTPPTAYPGWFIANSQRPQGG